MIDPVVPAYKICAHFMSYWIIGRKLVTKGLHENISFPGYVSGQGRVHEILELSQLEPSSITTLGFAGIGTIFWCQVG
jgi:hypothetical protein